MQSESDNDWFFIGPAIVTFIGSWIYCIATYGYLFGVGLGWLPSLIVAYVAGMLCSFVHLIFGKR